ncbi:MAG: SRPBCC family protein [Anaerolineales bacterium]
MTTLTNTYRVLINAQPETVFAYVSDLTRHPEWSGGRLKIEAVSSGPIAAGSRYHSHGDVAGQKDRPNELRVTQYQPPTRFAFVATDPDFGEVPHEFAFTPQAGGTLLERTVTVTLPPVRAFAFRTFIQPLIGKPMMDKALAALKAKLERPVV